NKLINVALWNRTIRSPLKFNRAQIESAAKPTIIGITALHVTNYEGTLQLKITNGSYVYLNPKAAETRMLEDLYKSGVPCGTHSAMLTQNDIPLSQILQMNEQDIKKNPFLQHKFRLEAKIVDGPNSIDATIFDNAATQLLKQTCSKLLTEQNPLQELLEIENKRAQFHIQIPPDQTPGKLKCIVNKAIFLEDEVDVGTSTPHPLTPAPKIYTSSAKRSLHLLDETEDPEDISTHRGKKKT
ncbi:LOW QUALITY PROTEIN: hypothetical protein M8C21_018562, partial [Ambrosia artemisiifolia]